MKIKNSKKLKMLKKGDALVFKKGEAAYIVQAEDYRYALACTPDGTEYTIIDKKEEVVASTNLIFETHSNFNNNAIAQEMLKMLHAGERKLSEKYRDTFSDWDKFEIYSGSKVFLANG